MAAVSHLSGQHRSITSETTALKQIDSFNYLIFIMNETCLLEIYMWLAMANGNCEYIQCSAVVNLQPPLNYKVAMLFLEVNTGSISSPGRISKLCLSP